MGEASGVATTRRKSQGLFIRPPRLTTVEGLRGLGALDSVGRVARSSISLRPCRDKHSFPEHEAIPDDIFRFCAELFELETRFGNLRPEVPADQPNVVALVKVQVPLFIPVDSGVRIGRVQAFVDRNHQKRLSTGSEHPPQFPKGLRRVDMFEHVTANNRVKLLILAIDVFDVPGDIGARHEQIR